jgi:hypothetical protein
VSPIADRQPSEGKVVRIEEFKAARARTCTGTAETVGEPRVLTPPEISHRFAMLAHLLGVERFRRGASRVLAGPGHMSTKAENVDILA